MKPDGILIFLRRVGMIAALLVMACTAQAVDVTGTLVTKEEKSFSGVIKWKAAQRGYVVSAGNRDMEFTLAQIKELTIPEPTGFRDAVKAIQEGRPQQAIPVLERIVQSYVMLQWDEPAARALAEACLNTGDTAGAMRVCEKVIVVKAEAAYTGEMAPIYWQTLLKAGKASKLDDLLDQAIKTGNPNDMACALIMRGDILSGKGDFKVALKDGYLRVITLFRAIRSVQPEALFKAAKAFDQINQVARAETMRKQLLIEFGSSDWARQLKGGT